MTCQGHSIIHLKLIFYALVIMKVLHPGDLLCISYNDFFLPALLAMHYYHEILRQLIYYALDIMTSVDG